MPARQSAMLHAALPLVLAFAAAACAGSSENGPAPRADGKCGPAATTYWDDAASLEFAGAFCDAGAAEPAAPKFPFPAGTSTTWTCRGMSGGADASCAARTLAPGQGWPVD